MEERRKFVRLNASVSIKWHKIGEEKGHSPVDNAMSKNISEAGLCLIIYEGKVAVGDILQLELKLSSQEKIVAKGRVVWVNEFAIVGQRDKKKYDAGVEFIDLSEENRDKIKKFVFTFFSQR